MADFDILKFYKRKDIQNAMIDSAQGREIAVRFSDKGFGKRPDILQFPNEVFELARQGATSFHSSEEIWENPKLISSDMRPKEIKKLRKGWDLILDIEFLHW